MSDEIRDFETGFATQSMWDDVAKASPEGWFWATSAMHEYRIACFEASGLLIADRSFVYLRDGRPCGLVPLVFGRDAFDGDIIAAYLDAPLPWPMVVAGMVDRESIQTTLFDELERRVAELDAAILRLMLAPRGLGRDLASSFARTVRGRAFVDVSYLSHCIDLTPATLGSVRERYRRDIRKHSDKYVLSILGADDLYDGIADLYMDLHVKDSGKTSRPLVTYERQMNLVRKGEGFWVAARNKAADRIVGMLLISVHKKAAYDNSVAVDPEFADDPVSHLMKWKAIEHLIEIGSDHYELGSAALMPSYLSQPSAKNYGISFFKDGWSRGRTKTVMAAEKFYSPAAFDRFWHRKGLAAKKHFLI
jgi:hypothetical protein